MIATSAEVLTTCKLPQMIRTQMKLLVILMEYRRGRNHSPLQSLLSSTN